MLEKLCLMRILVCFRAELRDFEPDDQQEIEVDEGNTAVIECHLPESQPKAQVRYSVKQEWLETSKGAFYLCFVVCLFFCQKLSVVLNQGSCDLLVGLSTLNILKHVLSYFNKIESYIKVFQLLKAFLLSKQI